MASCYVQFTIETLISVKIEENVLARDKKDIRKNEICSASIVLFNLNPLAHVSVTTYFNNTRIKER